MPGKDYYADADAKALQMIQAQGGDPGEDTLPPDQQQAAFQQGADQAKQDAAAAGVDAPQQPGLEQPAAPNPAAAAAPAAPAPDPNAAVFAKYGFTDAESMGAKFQETSAALTDALSQLEKMATLQKALDTENELDPNDPLYANKRAMREEFGPLYKNMQNDIKNRMVREAWTKDAEGLADLGDVEGDISEYILAHPELSMDKAGLRTAYNAVRSAKYQNPDKLLSDAEFQRKAAENPAIKDAVLKAYLTSIDKGGEGLPKPIDGGGNTPMSGKPAPYKNLNEAFEAAEKQFGNR